MEQLVFNYMFWAKSKLEENKNVQIIHITVYMYSNKLIFIVSVKNINKTLKKKKRFDIIHYNLIEILWNLIKNTFIQKDEPFYTELLLSFFFWNLELPTSILCNENKIINFIFKLKC